MFVRDPWTTETDQQSSPVFTALGAVPGASDQALLRELHGLALSMYQAKQDIQAAELRKDPAYIASRSQDLRTLATQFSATAKQYVGNDPEVLTAFDHIVLGVGTFLDNVVKALPGALAAIPGVFIDAIGIIGRKAGSTLLGLSLPVFALGIGAVAFLLYAERSRTVRRAVR